MLKPLDLSDNAVWKQRFRASQIFSAGVATRNTARGMALTNLSGVFQLHAWDIATGDLRQLTDTPTGVRIGGISPQGDYIYYLQDEGGNEIGHFVRVPYEGGTPESLTPDLPPYSGWFLSESLSGNKIGLMGASGGKFTLYTIDKNPEGSLGTRRVLYSNPAYSVGPFLSYNGDYGVIATNEYSGTTDFALMAFNLRTDSDQQKVLVLKEDDGGLSPVAFSPVAGQARLLANTDVTGFDRPLIWDVVTGDRIDIPLTGMDGDISALGWSPDGTKIVLRQLIQAQYQLYVYDVEQSTLTRLNHPQGTYLQAYFYTDDELFALVQNSLTPASVVALDAATGEQRREVLRSGDVPAGTRCQSVTFPSVNGQMIQGWLATPPGDGPFPTILETHGGPTAVRTDTFSPSAQAWVDHGFAFLSINYHGSTTFGRQFEHSILGNLGELEVQDMAAARDYLVGHGIAQPDMIILTGGSYGGYLTLLAMGKKPDLWAGGVAQVAIADWSLLYEDESEMLRGYQRSLFGGSPQEKPEVHAKASPSHYIANYKAPVLVIQGENDTRCPSRQMRIFEDQMRAQGKQIKLHWFEAGHGSLSIDESIHHQALAMLWVYQVLG